MTKIVFFFLNCQWEFFGKKWQFLSIYLKKWQFLSSSFFKMSSFGQFFDIQMAIFQRIRCVLLLTLWQELVEPVAVCVMISTLLNLSASVPACRRLVENSVISDRIHTLTSALTSDPILTSDLKVTQALWDMLKSALSLTEESSSEFNQFSFLTVSLISVSCS